FAVSGTWVWLVTGIGLFTMVWASFFALKQKDLKGILAFSTVSQLGLIMSLLGASAAGFHVENAAETALKYAGFAAIFHLINHAVFKGSLFMIAGIVDHETGTRDIRKLGGLMSLMPISFTIAMIGSFSMAGIPLFGGFLSKEMFLTAMLAITEFDLFSMDVWGLLFPVVAWFASVFTFIYSFYFDFHTFAGKHKPEELPKKAHEAPIGMLISPAILAVLVITIFFIPNFVGKWIVNPAVAAIQPFLYDSPSDVHVHVAAWHGSITPELAMTIGIFIIGGLMFWTLRKWQRSYDAFPDKVSLNRLYDNLMYLSDGGANRFSAVYMTGFIRSYLVYMFGFFILIVLSTLVLNEAFAFDLSDLAPIGFYEIVIVLALVGGTITILAAKSRLTAIIALGAVGYSVALFFVIFRAPDLALTQLVIETISVALFLLAFYHLPKSSKDR